MHCDNFSRGAAHSRQMTYADLRVVMPSEVIRPKSGSVVPIGFVGQETEDEPFHLARALFLPPLAIR
jgi:hypothetical protein